MSSMSAKLYRWNPKRSGNGCRLRWPFVPPCAASCTDGGIKNGQETGVDCGGSHMSSMSAKLYRWYPKRPGNGCRLWWSNVSSMCCYLYRRNSEWPETGVDCGGPTCPPCPTNGETTLGAYYFETGWDSWIDGGDDAIRYSGPRSFEGTFSISLRDNMLTESSMTSPVYTASSYAVLKVEFNFYSYSMEPGRFLASVFKQRRQYMDNHSPMGQWNPFQQQYFLLYNQVYQ